MACATCFHWFRPLSFYIHGSACLLISTTLEKTGLYNYDLKSSMEFINTECIMYGQNIKAITMNASKYRHIQVALYSQTTVDFMLTLC